MSITTDDILMPLVEKWNENGDLLGEFCAVCGKRHESHGYGIPWDHTLTDCLIEQRLQREAVR